MTSEEQAESNNFVLQSSRSNSNFDRFNISKQSHQIWKFQVSPPVLCQGHFWEQLQRPATLSSRPVVGFRGAGQGRTSSASRVMDCRQGRRGFDSRDQTNTQGLKMTEKWRYCLYAWSANCWTFILFLRFSAYFCYFWFGHYLDWLSCSIKSSCWYSVLALVSRSSSVFKQ